MGIDTGNVLWANGVRTLATMTETTDYAEGVRRTTVAQFEKRGGTVAAEERYASDVTDFRSQLNKLLSANPDALHLAPQSEFAAGTIIKQARELGYEGPIYAETVSVGTTALEIAGDAATGMKAITADLDPDNEKAQEVLADFRERYNYVTLPWHLGSAYDDVYIAAECLKRTNDDQDADGFRDCMYEITWSGAIGDNYSFDEQGEVVGLFTSGGGGTADSRADGGPKVRRAGASASAVGPRQRTMTPEGLANDARHVWHDVWVIFGLHCVLRGS